MYEAMKPKEAARVFERLLWLDPADGQDAGGLLTAVQAGRAWARVVVLMLSGLTVIVDRCLKVEHARYIGRMHWLGFNTARITSVRSGLQ